jgi:hypothetical protein
LASTNAEKEVLEHLANGLDDLNFNVVIDMLKRSPKPGKPKKPKSIWRRRAFMALAVEALTRDNPFLIERGFRPTAMSIEDAYEHVTRTYLGGGDRVAKADLTKNLKTWRHELANERVNEPDAAKVFKDGLALLHTESVVPLALANNWINQALSSPEKL